MKVNKLPISEIFFQSIFLIKNKYLELIRLCFPYVVVIFFSTIYNVYYSESGESVNTFSVLGYLILFIEMLTLLLATIGAHRVFIMPDSQVANTKSLRWTWRETRFLGWWLVMILVVCLTVLPISLLFFGIMIQAPSELSVFDSNLYWGIIIGSSLFLMYYLLARLSLVLPATAIDQKGRSLKWSWRLSQGNSFRLFILIGCIPLLTNLFIYFLPESDGIILNLAYSFIALIVGVIEICLLSLSFSFLSKASDESNNMNSEILITPETII
jgi:hypothetical protein